MTRDGLFHVTRSHSHWGNGITPTGGAVLVHLIDAAPGIINAATGRSADSQASSRSNRQAWAGWDAYRVEQKRATDLLAKLDGMANGTTPSPPANLPLGEFPPREELLQKYGSVPDPWVP